MNITASTNERKALFCESLGQFQTQINKRLPENFDSGFVHQYLGWILDDLYSRFEAKVSEAPNGCWNWTGTMDGKGYGRVSFFNRPRQAYRVAYELYVGPIPSGLVLDHLCRNPSCVNPQHLEPVTPGENTRRGKTLAASMAQRASRTHCKYGHPLVKLGKQRGCRVCINERKKQYRRLLSSGPNLSGLKLGAAASSLARKARTHCRRGHEFTPENTGIQASGRFCRSCDNMRARNAKKVSKINAL